MTLMLSQIKFEAIPSKDIGGVAFQAEADALHQRTCEVERMGEISSFIFTCYIKIVPVYDFKLV